MNEWSSPWESDSRPPSPKRHEFERAENTDREQQYSRRKEPGVPPPVLQPSTSFGFLAGYTDDAAWGVEEEGRDPAPAEIKEHVVARKSPALRAREDQGSEQWRSSTGLGRDAEYQTEDLFGQLDNQLDSAEVRVQDVPKPARLDLDDDLAVWGVANDESGAHEQPSIESKAEKQELLFDDFAFDVPLGNTPQQIGHGSGALLDLADFDDPVQVPGTGKELEEIAQARDGSPESNQEEPSEADAFDGASQNKVVGADDASREVSRNADLKPDVETATDSVPETSYPDQYRQDLEVLGDTQEELEEELSIHDSVDVQRPARSLEPAVSDGVDNSAKESLQSATTLAEPTSLDEELRLADSEASLPSRESTISIEEPNAEQPLPILPSKDPVSSIETVQSQEMGIAIASGARTIAAADDDYGDFGDFEEALGVQETTRENLNADFDNSVFPNGSVLAHIADTTQNNMNGLMNESNRPQLDSASVLEEPEKVEPEFHVDKPVIKQLFPEIESAEPAPEAPDQLIQSTSQRKAWHLISRQASLRYYNSSDFDNYVRVTWPGSAIQAKVTNIVAKWVADDKATGGSLFKPRFKSTSKKAKQDKTPLEGDEKQAENARLATGIHLKPPSSPLGFGWNSMTPPRARTPVLFPPPPPASSTETNPSKRISSNAFQDPDIRSGSPASLQVPQPPATPLPTLNTGTAVPSEPVNIEQDDDDFGTFISSAPPSMAPSIHTVEASRAVAPTVHDDDDWFSSAPLGAMQPPPPEKPFQSDTLSISSLHTPPPIIPLSMAEMTPSQPIKTTQEPVLESAADFADLGDWFDMPPAPVPQNHHEDSVTVPTVQATHPPPPALELHLPQSDPPLLPNPFPTMSEMEIRPISQVISKPQTQVDDGYDEWPAAPPSRQTPPQIQEAFVRVETPHVGPNDGFDALNSTQDSSSPALQSLPSGTKTQASSQHTITSAFDFPDLDQWFNSAPTRPMSQPPLPTQKTSFPPPPTTNTVSNDWVNSPVSPHLNIAPPPRPASAMPQSLTNRTQKLPSSNLDSILSASKAPQTSLFIQPPPPPLPSSLMPLSVPTQLDASPVPQLQPPLLQTNVTTSPPDDDFDDFGTFVSSPAGSKIASISPQAQPVDDFGAWVVDEEPVISMNDGGSVLAPAATSAAVTSPQPTIQPQQPPSFASWSTPSMTPIRCSLDNPSAFTRPPEPQTRQQDHIGRVDEAFVRKVVQGLPDWTYML